MNLITDETRRAAAGLVRDGQPVSLSRDMDPENPDPLGRGTVLQRYMEIDKVSQCSTRFGRPPHWARSCARSPMAMSSS